MEKMGATESSLNEEQKKEDFLIVARNIGKQVELTINGKHYTVPGELPASCSLNSFIRSHAHLKGTKFMCLEGGCGTCIVNVTSLHPTTGKEHSYAVNSCLVPVLACHGWSVTTVEGLGNKKLGYDKVVSRLAAANGTQCGFCSPGMVMNMYSLLKSNPKITMKEVENSFGGNICRCTGYRPILDAFKSLASDAPEKLVSKLVDIEDMMCPERGVICEKGGREDCGQLCSPKAGSSLRLDTGEGNSWYRPASLQEVFEILDLEDGKEIRYVAGNTGQGVYRIQKEPDAWIDLNGLGELHGWEVSSEGLTLGANISLTEAMEVFYKLAREQSARFTYCKTLADHIDLVANVPVRNIGTIAGNLSLKHSHPEFPSDIFLILEMVGAQLVLGDVSGMEATIGLQEYLQTDMTKKIIKKILLPNIDSSKYTTLSYKVMPRAQNAHAYVNAGFLLKADRKNKFYISEKPTIVFGGIQPGFVHASKTEDYLNGKQLLNEGTLKGALEVLASELNPDHVPPDATPQYRKGLAQSLFYKFVLCLGGDKVSEKYRSGGPLLQRPLSTAKQDFDTNQKVWPLNKPVPKIEALGQCSGEVEYANDTPDLPGQVWAQLVLSDRANAIVSKIDPSHALKLPGVVAFFSAKDIPGKNTFMPKNEFFAYVEEVIFVDGRTQYAGQCLGVIVAETLELANKAAKLVKVEYTDQQKPVLDLKEVLHNKMSDRIKEKGKITPKNQGKDIKETLSGSLYLKEQYHFTMETQTCVAVPTEDHLEVYSSTQWPSIVQEAISLALNLPQNSIDLRVRRLGGGYGSKISRNNHAGVVSSLVAHLLHRPVRLVLTIENNTEWAGKRFPVYGTYQVGVNSEGEIQYLNASMYHNDGHGTNDSAIGLTLLHLSSGYDISRWNVTCYGVRTDHPSNTFCRAPGSCEGIAFIESIMEHIANATGKDPLAVRLANMNKTDPTTADLMKDLRKKCDYDSRLKQIQDYNQKNRWKKRGISVVPMLYPFGFWGNFYALVSIYGRDGTVAITHGGIEMGQGINTKVAQVAGYLLGVPLESIAIKPTMTHISPNNAVTGGSIGSEAVCYAVKMCCEKINERLKPIREKLGKDATWVQITTEAYTSTVDLSEKYMFTSQDDVKNYSIYCIGCTEVELDVLTGQYLCRRVDILEDAGESLSPEVDIGQVEGAFIMGLGYYTSEEIVHDKSSGRLLTNRTWNYKPPGAKDIPADFRIELRKNAPNPTGVLRSKATGEPPLCLSCSVLFALRNAMESARKDAGLKETWFDIDPPYTAETLWLGCATKPEMFKL